MCGAPWQCHKENETTTPARQVDALRGGARAECSKEPWKEGVLKRAGRRDALDGNWGRQRSGGNWRGLGPPPAASVGSLAKELGKVRGGNCGLWARSEDGQLSPARTPYCSRRVRLARRELRLLREERQSWAVITGDDGDDWTVTSIPVISPLSQPRFKLCAAGGQTCEDPNQQRHHNLCNQAATGDWTCVCNDGSGRRAVRSLADCGVDHCIPRQRDLRRGRAGVQRPVPGARRLGATTCPRGRTRRPRGPRARRTPRPRRTARRRRGAAPPTPQRHGRLDSPDAIEIQAVGYFCSDVLEVPRPLAGAKEFVGRAVVHWRKEDPACGAWAPHLPSAPQLRGAEPTPAMRRVRIGAAIQYRLGAVAFPCPPPCSASQSSPIRDSGGVCPSDSFPPPRAPVFAEVPAALHPRRVLVAAAEHSRERAPVAVSLSISDRRRRRPLPAVCVGRCGAQRRAPGSVRPPRHVLSSGS
eukprot:gene8009-biopygen10574